MKRNYQYLIIFVFTYLMTLIPNLSYSQGAAINLTGAVADSSAGLDIDFNDRGLLIPRLTNAERNAITSPAEGLQIFNTDNKCFEYFAYGIWQQWHCAVCPIPDAAGSITGSSSVCQSDNSVTYSVPSINNANSYIWSYSGTGATITGTSESVTIDFSGTATSGNLTVKGNNQCGDGIVSSNFSITVSGIPSTPTAGTHTPSQTEIAWNWGTVSGATGYKYHTANDYANATDNGTNTTYTQIGLTCNTSNTLYVWAYNNCGSSVELTLSESTTSCCPASFVDSRDGKTYQALEIGTQCWMRENLNYTSANSWCYDNDPGNCTTYGRLYTWDAATIVCPSGWHLPTDAEWTQLTDYLSANSQYVCSVTSTQIAKSLASTTNWNTSTNTNTCAVGNDLNTNNSSGFTALPGGIRRSNGAFDLIGDNGNWWSATEDDSDAWRRYLNLNNAAVYRNTEGKGYGHAVRCLSD